MKNIIINNKDLVWLKYVATRFVMSMDEMMVRNDLVKLNIYLPDFS